MPRLLAVLLLLLQDPQADFQKRLATRRAEAQKRLDEAKRALADRRKADEQAAKALRERLAAKPLTLTLRSGQSHPNAIIRSFTLTDIDIGTACLPWAVIAPPSVLAAADAIYEPDVAARQFERGRFLAGQRLWKEAKDAFQRAVKLDADLEERAEDVLAILDRVMAGQGAFGGDARRTGAAGLTLAYDFKSDTQLKDFTEGFTIADGAAVLETQDDASVYLTIDFHNEIDVELTLATDGPFFIELMENYGVTLDEDGVTLERFTKDDAKELAAGKIGLSKGKTHDVRVSLRERKFTVAIDRREALAHQEKGAGTLKGPFGLGVAGGKARIASLVVRGAVNPRDVEKRYAQVDVLVRRAVDPDLKEIADARERSGGEKIGTLTAEDPRFMLDLGRDLARYDEVKTALRRQLSEGGSGKTVRKDLDDLIGQYPGVPALWYLRALHFEDREDIPAADRDARKAVDLFPGFAEALTLRGRLQDWDSDYEGAHAMAQKAIDALPDYAPAWVLRAIAGYGKDPAKAEQWMEDLRLALELSPGNADAATNLRAIRYQSRGPRDLGCRFEHESAHYRVVTDISAEAAKAYAERLEAAYGHFAETFRHAYREKPFPKPRVAIFNTAENYYTYSELVTENRDEDTLGSYTDRWNELVLFDDVDHEETLDTLYHEAFHQFTTLMVRHTLPYWYSEGIAEYMAGITVKDAKVVEKGKIQKMRLDDLRIAFEDRTVLPFEELMLQTPAEFYDDPDNVKYAQSWSMVRFFYERHRPLIEAYFDRLRAKKTAREAFDGTFKEKCEELEKEWRAYVESLR